jgi:hypothetical protein
VFKLIDSFEFATPGKALFCKALSTRAKILLKNSPKTIRFYYAICQIPRFDFYFISLRYSALLMHKNPLQIFFEKYVQGTVEKGSVPIEKLLLCAVSTNLVKVLGFKKRMSASISTLSLKHMYDKKPAEEFDCILKALVTIIQYPLLVYKNTDYKRGTYCLVGMYKQREYVCSIQIVENEAQVVTCFRKRDEKYLNKYILLWSREVDSPSIAHP